MFFLRREEIIIISIVIVSCLVLGLFILCKGKKLVDWETSSGMNFNLEPTTVTQPEPLIIHIAGAVARPGVYSLKEGSRVFDALSIAGGETKEANLSKINLATPLRDGIQIIIPYETNNSETSNGSPGRININAASQSLLETLPGIGPSKASAIIKYRLENNYFLTIEDLMNVSGIGEKTFSALKDLIDVY